jgi:hemerythrin
MTSLNWSDEYHINVEEIDEQHRQMADLVEELHLAVENGADPDTLKHILRSLIDHTREHFATEEDLMDQHGYPKARIHKAEHESLLKQLDIVQQSLVGGKIPAFCKNVDISSDWMMVHVTNSDSELGKFLNGRIG